MKTIGFICEGETEALIVKSDAFSNLLLQNNLKKVEPVIDAGGIDKLKKYIVKHTQVLKGKNASTILVFADLEQLPCFTERKKHIGLSKDYEFTISKRKTEAWFLASSKLLSAAFKKNFEFELPENESAPEKTLQKLFVEHIERGLGPSKALIAKRMLNNGFSIEEAANHPNCPSAKYFIDKLKMISSG